VTSPEYKSTNFTPFKQPSVVLCTVQENFQLPNLAFSHPCPPISIPNTSCFKLGTANSFQIHYLDFFHFPTCSPLSVSLFFYPSLPNESFNTQLRCQFYQRTFHDSDLDILFCPPTALTTIIVYCGQYSYNSICAVLLCFCVFY